jgi:hypothetical protein
MNLELKQTIAAMMTENTGTHGLDSGGAYGRNWQRNAGLTCNDFDAMPAAILEIDLRKWQDKPHADMMLSVNIYHKLTSGILELDDLCRQFNAMPVDDWKSDLNGVSDSGENWLSDRGFVWDDRHCGFNTYNWENNFSQVLQGNFVARDGEYGEDNYVLLQIHGGADVRGGYTDAKLFKLCEYAEEHDLLRDNCGFSVETDDGYLHLNWSGEWITGGGSCAHDDDLLEFAIAAGASIDQRATSVIGDQYNDV